MSAAVSGAMARSWPRSWRGLGVQRGEAVTAIAQGPLQQRVHRDLAAGGVRNVVETSGDLLGAPGQFAARQGLQHQRRDESVSEQSDLFGFVVVHELGFSGLKRKGKDGAVHANGVWGSSGGGRSGGEIATRRPSGASERRPAQQVLAQVGEQETMSADPAGGGRAW